MTKKHYRNKKSISIFLALILCLITSISKYNIVLANSTEIQIDSKGNKDIVPYGGYHTFCKFEGGTYNGAYGVSFYVDKPCVLKFMQVSKYADGSTGTLSYVLEQKTGLGYINWSGTTAMTGTGQTVLPNNRVCNVGTYNLLLIPNDPAKSFIINGEVYTLDY